MESISIPGPESVTSSLPSVSSKMMHDINLADAVMFNPEAYFENSEFKKTQNLAFFIKQAGAISHLNDILNDGNQLLFKLYSYRSCARVIPQSTNMTAEDRKKLYEITHQILEPEISKMRRLCQFHVSTFQSLFDIFNSILPDISNVKSGKRSEDKDDLFVTGEFLRVMARILDLCVVMDAMKNLKSSMNNDFSLYKRCLPVIANTISMEEENKRNFILYQFLANPDIFLTEFKSKLMTVLGSDELMIDISNYCVEQLEKSAYVLHEEKHMYLK
ncbi:Cytoplasmic FMR1-interacting protein 2, partial [Nowakowskiella sp. JEL0078]